MAKVCGVCCCYLRWRGLDEDGLEAHTPHVAEGFFLCSVTQGVVGPDRRVADDESCRPGRVCYEPPGPQRRPLGEAESAGAPAGEREP